MRWLSGMLHGVEISPGFVAMWICVVAGAFLLTNYTRISGVMGFLLNALALFAGAQLANYLGADLRVPFEYLLAKTLMVTIGGMLVKSLLVLLVFSRSRSG